jgi:signal transduction histidine kinase
LRPLLLDHLGLIAAIDHYTELWSQSSKVDVSADYAPELSKLSRELELALFRIVQESLTNVAKYARAENVRIALGMASGELRLSVEDDGVGIDPAILERRRSHGIIGMKQRIAQFGGSLDVRRRSGGNGTIVSARVPVVAGAT